jgi:hypothetical protein
MTQPKNQKLTKTKHQATTAALAKAYKVVQPNLKNHDPGGISKH